MVEGGFPMIHLCRVGHVGLRSQDLEKGEMFSTEMLGFEVVACTERARGIFFKNSFGASAGLARTE
jgi:catechol-2,3-dioxygenase